MDWNLPSWHYLSANDLAGKTFPGGFSCFLLVNWHFSVLRLRLLLLISVLVKDVSVSCEFPATVGSRIAENLAAMALTNRNFQLARLAWKDFPTKNINGSPIFLNLTLKKPCVSRSLFRHLYALHKIPLFSPMFGSLWILHVFSIFDRKWILNFLIGWLIISGNLMFHVFTAFPGRLFSPRSATTPSPPTFPETIWWWICLITG